MTKKILVRLIYKNGLIDITTLPVDKVKDVELIDYEAVPFIFKRFTSDMVAEFEEVRTLAILGGEVVD